MIRIFWSWQSKENKTNKNFIEDCLKRAVKIIEKDYDTSITIFQDSRNKTGANEISTEIFKSIDECLVFIGDVSIVNRFKYPKLGFINKWISNHRNTPNSNVLIELGYASGKISWDNVVLVLNKSLGEIEMLPFDLRGRKTIIYNLSKNQSKATERTKLVNQLKFSILAIISPVINKQASDKTEFNKFLLKQRTNICSMLAHFTMDLALATKNKYIKFPFNNMPPMGDIISSLKIVNAKERVKTTIHKGGFSNWFEYLKYITSQLNKKISEVENLGGPLNNDIKEDIDKIRRLISTELELGKVNLGNTNLEFWSKHIIELIQLSFKLNDDILIHEKE